MQLANHDGASVGIDDAAMDALQATLHGPLLRPGQSGYDAARVVFNGLFDRGGPA